MVPDIPRRRCRSPDDQARRCRAISSIFLISASDGFIAGFGIVVSGVVSATVITGKPRSSCRIVSAIVFVFAAMGWGALRRCQEP